MTGLGKYLLNGCLNALYVILCTYCAPGWGANMVNTIITLESSYAQVSTDCHT